MVGYYATSTPGPLHGFLLRDGIFANIDYPGAESTIASGINDSGLIVGRATKNDSALQVGFLYDGATFTKIRVPGQSQTTASGINNQGEVVGAVGTFAGYELREGRFRRISPPGQFLVVAAAAINNFGEVVGISDNGGDGKGFLYRRGEYTTIVIPSASITYALGINDDDIIVGWYQTGSSFSGFARNTHRYASLNFPGAKYTFGAGINASAQVVGSYTDAHGVDHGFVTSPLLNLVANHGSVKR
jgi:uncharacterized membrane protein